MYSIKELNNSQKVCQHILIENLSDFINRFLSNVYKNCKDTKIVRKGRMVETKLCIGIYE